MFGTTERVRIPSRRFIPFGHVDPDWKVFFRTSQPFVYVYRWGIQVVEFSIQNDGSFMESEENLVCNVVIEF